MDQSFLKKPLNELTEAEVEKGLQYLSPMFLKLTETINRLTKTTTEVNKPKETLEQYRTRLQQEEFWCEERLDREFSLTGRHIILGSPFIDRPRGLYGRPQHLYASEYKSVSDPVRVRVG